MSPSNPARIETSRQSRARPLNFLQSSALRRENEPAELDRAIEDGRPEVACQMRTALAPVEARPAEWALALGQSYDVDAELGEKALAVVGDQADAVPQPNEILVLKRMGDGDAEPARQMIVAESRQPHLSIARTVWPLR